MLQSKYPAELKILKELFSEGEVNKKLKRLNEIYAKTEVYWHKYLGDIPNKKVKYLLIAEAPPYSKSGEVAYLLNPKSEPRSLLKPITESFFNEPIYEKFGFDETLIKLAKRGFLIIDSIPFAMYYSKIKYVENKKTFLRSTHDYKELIKNSCKNYLLEKINESQIAWNENTRIALAFRKNAEVLIEEFSKGIPIKEIGLVKISKDQIAAGPKNYPTCENLKRIFDL